MMIALYLVPRMAQHQTLGSVRVIGDGRDGSDVRSVVRSTYMQYVREMRETSISTASCRP